MNSSHNNLHRLSCANYLLYSSVGNIKQKVVIKQTNISQETEQQLLDSGHAQFIEQPIEQYQLKEVNYLKPPFGNKL